MKLAYASLAVWMKDTLIMKVIYASLLPPTFTWRQGFLSHSSNFKI